MKRWCLQWLAVLAMWMILGLIDTSQTAYFLRSRNIEVPTWAIVVLGFLDWSVWALLTPLIVLLARYAPLDRPSWPRLLLHAISSLATAVGLILILTVVTPHVPGALREQFSPAELFHILLVQRLLMYVIIHWLILGVTHGVMFYNRYRERELQASRLQTELVQAQVQMLKMQIHPHFLFNTLHAISALMHKDVNLADSMLARLGSLLRATLESTAQQEVALRKELELLQLYLDIEQARLGSRLEMQMEIEPAALDGIVPHLLLQPLVENAVRHGIAPLRGPGSIIIRASRNGNQLQIEIEDTGRGFYARDLDSLSRGVGISNTRARLQHLYGSEHTFQIDTGARGGALVSILIPYRVEEISEAMVGELAPYAG